MLKRDLSQGATYFERNVCCAILKNIVFASKISNIQPSKILGESISKNTIIECKLELIIFSFIPKNFFVICNGVAYIINSELCSTFFPSIVYFIFLI